MKVSNKNEPRIRGHLRFIGYSLIHSMQELSYEVHEERPRFRREDQGHPRDAEVSAHEL